MGLFLIMEHIIPKEELRLVYGEIVRGSSYFNSKKYGDIIIKHLTQEDTEMLDVKKLKYKRKAEEKGLPTEQEKIEDLIKDSLWSHEKERDIKASKDFISKMEDTKKKMALKSERRRVQESLDQEQDKLDKLLMEKKDLVGLTSETYSDRKVNDYYIYLSLYKDRKFKEPLFSEKEFDEVSENDLTNIMVHFNKVSRKFDQSVIKRIAISHFFLNNFYFVHYHFLIVFLNLVIILYLFRL